MSADLALNTPPEDAGPAGTVAGPAGTGRAADLLGRPLTGPDREVLRVYDALKGLVADPELAPCAAANLRSALAAVAIAVTDLGLDFEHLIDMGV